MVGISAANELLPSFVLFRGEKVSRDVQNLESDATKISANKSAWIDVKTFEKWIDKARTSYSVRFKMALLIIDCFRVHKQPNTLKLFITQKQYQFQQDL